MTRKKTKVVNTVKEALFERVLEDYEIIATASTEEVHKAVEKYDKDKEGATVTNEIFLLASLRYEQWKPVFRLTNGKTGRLVRFNVGDKYPQYFYSSCLRLAVKESENSELRLLKWSVKPSGNNKYFVNRSMKDANGKLFTARRGRMTLEVLNGEMQPIDGKEWNADHINGNTLDDHPNNMQWLTDWENKDLKYVASQDKPYQDLGDKFLPKIAEWTSLINPIAENQEEIESRLEEIRKGYSINKGAENNV